MDAAARPYPTIIKDRFFEDPNEVRTWALSQEFLNVDQHNQRYGVRESWPGLRTQALSTLQPQLEQAFANHLLAQVMRLPPTNYEINASFQLTRANDGDSWVHRDDVRFDVAGLVYMTPDPAPQSGTVFYVEDGKDNYVVTDRVANQYNRVLLFDSQCWHKSDRYFGADLPDARLTLPFFIRLLDS